MTEYNNLLSTLSHQLYNFEKFTKFIVYTCVQKIHSFDMSHIGDLFNQLFFTYSTQKKNS